MIQFMCNRLQTAMPWINAVNCRLVGWVHQASKSLWWTVKTDLSTSEEAHTASCLHQQQRRTMTMNSKHIRQHTQTLSNNKRYSCTETLHHPVSSVTWPLSRHYQILRHFQSLGHYLLTSLYVHDTSLCCYSFQTLNIYYLTISEKLLQMSTWQKNEQFITRQHTDAQYWHSNVCPSVRDVQGLDENGLTYCHSFFTIQ